MKDTVTATPIPHVITLSDRCTLTATGVTDVDSFDETVMVIYTSQGELTVKGTGLHITRLNVETGDLSLEGQIDSLCYADMKLRTGGFFGKLFR
jgi:sporulation protein YabP